MKQILASFLVGLMLLGNGQMVYAATNDVGQPKAEIVNTTTSGVDDLGVQLNDLYKQVGGDLKIDYMYVKLLHLLAGGKAIYADKRPNIYSEITVNSIAGPFDIEGVNQTYSVQAPWAFCPDATVSRPNKYYLPDAAYNVTAEVVRIMNNRYYADRGSVQPYFDALKKDVKTNILFCEAVLQYTGSTPEVVNSFYPVYEKILYDKKRDENVVQVNADGTYAIKDKFKDVFTDNGIKTEKELATLSLILSFDKNLAISDSPDNIKDEYVVPYKVGYTSRENMMLAGMSLIGKVRYVWGGGHDSTGTIQGINPAWKLFFDTYPTDPKAEGFGRCIQPSYNWCPIHKAYESSNACIFKSGPVASVDDYIAENKSVMDTKSLTDEKFKTLITDDVKLGNGLTAHRLDGLDCSGYTSWLFNQIDRTRKYDSGARWFIGDSGLTKVDFNSKLLPGDIFSWGDHIVTIVGGVSSGSNAYVMLEASPNMVKFGVLYHGGSASSTEVEEARSIATEANNLLGGIQLTEKTHVDNMDGIKNSSEYAEVARYSKAFIDENTVLSDYDKTIKTMTAKEIIQHTINKLPEQFLTGLNAYTGTIFDVSKIKSNKIVVQDTAVKTDKDVKVVSVDDTKAVEKLVDLGK